MAVHSHSSLGLFEQCPRRYFYRCIARIEVPEPMETIECYLGSRLHDTLEHFYREHRRGFVLSLPNLVRYYRRAWHRSWRSTIDLRGGGPPEQWRALGDRCIARYYRRHQPFRDAETVGVEMRIEFPLDDDPTGAAHLVIGYADRVARRLDGTWEIHDYKSGKWDPRQVELDADRQLAIYQIGVKRRFPEAGDIELVWHLLESDRTARSRRSDEQLAALRQQLLRLIRDVESRGDDEDAHPTRPGPLCDFCEYRRVCPEWTDER